MNLHPNGLRGTLEADWSVGGMATILVIDDEEPVRIVMRRLLERAGYRVIVAENGRTGLKAFRDNDVDVVLTDILMPEHDGLELIMKLRGEKPDAKIIAMSGGGKTGVMDFLDLAASYGASRILSKPVSNAELLEAVEQLLKRA